MDRALTALLEEWQLTADGTVRPGRAARVLPVRTASGAPAVLKVGDHETAALEALALQRWAGIGAVRLLRADPHRSALLLERLHAEDLSDLWDVEACEVVTGLWRDLHVPAGPQYPTLTSYVAGWASALAELPRNAPLPHRMVEHAASLARDFASDEATSGTLVHTDLHYRNVLAGDREPWLAVAPKPLSGDPHVEVAPLLWHRYDELAGDLRGGLRRRFHALVDGGGLDEDRARDWVIVRVMHRALETVGQSGAEARARLTACLAIAKAVQD